jgi:pimeloyl-ACP methyl ester carboxylesterase
MNADLSGHKITEGYIPFAGQRTWYQITGAGEDPGKYPLLCLHGGPEPAPDRGANAAVLRRVR